MSSRLPCNFGCTTGRVAQWVDSGWTVEEEENLTKLSSLGHFLKGATLGVSKVQASCELVQMGFSTTVISTTRI